VKTWLLALLVIGLSMLWLSATVTFGAFLGAYAARGLYRGLRRRPDVQPPAPAAARRAAAAPARPVDFTPTARIPVYRPGRATDAWIDSPAYDRSRPLTVAALVGGYRAALPPAPARRVMDRPSWLR
jgi:hypothetical protein